MLVPKDVSLLDGFGEGERHSSLDTGLVVDQGDNDPGMEHHSVAGARIGNEGEAGVDEAGADLDLGGGADPAPLHRLDDS
jgi:hypothetical protein